MAAAACWEPSGREKCVWDFNSTSSMRKPSAESKLTNGYLYLCTSISWKIHNNSCNGTCPCYACTQKTEYRHPIIKFPLTTMSAVKKTEDNKQHTGVHCGCQDQQAPN
eukprot:bmy_22493T0